MAAVVALGGAGLVATGCGGSGSSEPAKAAGITATPQAPPTRDAHKKRTRHNKAQPKRVHKAPPRKAPAHRRKPKQHKRPHSLEQASRQAAGKVPPTQRASVAKGTAKIVFETLGLHPASLRVSPNGGSIEATLAAGDACSSSPSTEGQVASRIQKTLPYVRSVKVGVAGSGQPLRQYIRSSCAGSGLPGGTGRVVLTRRGSTFATTKPFTIHSKRWTVEYVNGGKFLQILPLEGQLPTAGAFTVTKRGSGKRVFKGAGTYSLRIGGMGNWVVRVRDGA